MQIINKLLLLLLILCVSCKKELSSDSGSIGNQQVKVYDFKLANAKDCSDGGYILATTNSLVKLTSDGQVSWMKKYTDYNIDTITFKYSGGGNVIQNADGGFSLMISGIFKKVDNSYFCIVKTDQFGNKIDILKFYFPFSKQVFTDAFSFAISYDNAYYITFAYQDAQLNYLRAVFKCDINTGTVLWQKSSITYFGSVFGDIRNIIVPKNNDLVLVGGYEGKNNGASIFYSYFVRLDPDGNLISERKYAMGGRGENGNFAPSYLVKASQNSSTDIFMMGTTDRGKGVRTHNQYMVIKVNAVGDSLTSTILGNSKQDFCKYGIITSDQGFGLLGFSSFTDVFDNPVLKNSMYFVKLDQNMSIQKSLIYGEFLDTEGQFLKENSDKSYTILGNKYGYSNVGKQQTVFIKTLPGGGL